MTVIWNCLSRLPSAVKCLSQGHNRMARVVLNQGHVHHKYGALTTRPRCPLMLESHCIRLMLKAPATQKLNFFELNDWKRLAL